MIRLRKMELTLPFLLAFVLMAGAAEPALFTYFFFCCKNFCEDAAALRLGGGSRKAASKAAPAIKSARSERPSERQRSPAPKRGEWGTGDVGAPTGAVH